MVLNATITAHQPHRATVKAGVLLSTFTPDLQRPENCFPWRALFFSLTARNLPDIMRKLCPSIVLLCCALSPMRGDTMELNSRQEVTGTVTKYANYNFELRSADGRTATYPASSVRRIVFAASRNVAKLTTRTNGLQEGTLSSFDNGAFNIMTAAGARQFPLIFVERAAFVADRGQPIEVITHGSQVDITRHLVSGNVTIVDFYADWCGPCKKISPVLEEMARTDPEIAVRKIDIVNWNTAVAKEYNIRSIPQVNVYGRSGHLVGTVIGADPEQVKRYVSQAKSGG
jgi:thiol-disulfide isomerase/thioredoxin